MFYNVPSRYTANFGAMLYVFAGYPRSKLEKIILEDPPIPSIDWLEDK
jgi:hypothetical protein